MVPLANNLLQPTDRTRKKRKTVENSQTEVKPEDQKVKKLKAAESKEHYCHFSDESHPLESHTISNPES